MRRAPWYLVLLLTCGLLSACSATPSTSPNTDAAYSSSQSLVETYSASPSVEDQEEGTEDPPLSESRDVPAYQPDVEVPLSYSLDGTSHTVSGLRHYGIQGYSMVYDPSTFTRQGWEDGDAYMASTGNYLSVSRINGMDAATVRQGLILQENIPDLGQQVTVGSQNYTAHTLVVSPQDGIFRQFWILDLADHNTLLVEQSYVMDGPNAALYQALQLAMLDTLTLE